MTQKTIDSSGLPERVQYMIDQLGLTPTSFSEKASINRTVIVNLLNGRNAPSLETINKILSAYSDWSPDWLLFNQGSPQIEESVPFSTDSEFSQNLALEKKYSEILKNQEEIKSMFFSTTEGSQPIERTIEEIRIFYTDDSFEVFRKI